MIIFEECQTWGYPARTMANIEKSDVTLAFAINFDTAGEKLTKILCLDLAKAYIRVNLSSLDMSYERIHRVAERIDLLERRVVINIAGNGIYSLSITQKNLDEWMFQFLYGISHNMKKSIASIHSGGQTGVDEAGAKAADKLDIPTTILAPKGWTFRDITGKNISNEKLFKARFV